MALFKVKSASVKDRTMSLGRTLAKDIGAVEVVSLALKNPLIAIGALGVAAWYQHRKKKTAAAERISKS
jgi:hypothetical protein